MTESRYPFFGELRPSLSSIKFEEKGDLTIYPIILDRSNFDGPALLPIVPYPKSFNVPEDKNLLRLAYTGNASDIQIEVVDDRAVNDGDVKQTEIDGRVIYSLLLDDAVVADGALVIGLLCRDEREVLIYSSVKSTSFFPFILPLGAD